MKNNERREDDDSVVDIDEHALDHEWVRQSRLVRMWTQKLADARREWEDARIDEKQAQARLDDAEAKLVLEVKKNPAAFDLDKPTEKAVDATVRLQPEYKDAEDASFKAMRRVVRLKYEAESVESVVKALADKKAGLESLVYLHGQAYFGEPRARPENREEMAERVNKKVFGNKKGQR